MQTFLMVAALECRSSSIPAERLYNDFVQQNRTSLHGYNDSLREHFFRASGMVEGRAAYDHFTTALANRQSRTATDDGRFCEDAEMLGRLAADSDAQGVLALAGDLSERPFGVGASCDETRREQPRAFPALAALPPRDPEPPLAPVEVEQDVRGEPPVVMPVAEQDAPPAPASASAEVAPADLSVAEPAPVIVAGPPVAVPAVAVPVVVAAAPVPAPVLVAVAKPAPVAAPEPAPAKAVPVKVVAVSARTDPAQALAAAAEALRIAAEAVARANEAPVDAAPVIHERVRAAKKL